MTAVIMDKTDWITVHRRLPEACTRYPDIKIEINDNGNKRIIQTSRALLHAMCPSLEIGPLPDIDDLPIIQMDIVPEELHSLIPIEKKEDTSTEDGILVEKNMDDDEDDDDIDDEEMVSTPTRHGAADDAGGITFNQPAVSSKALPNMKILSEKIPTLPSLPQAVLGSHLVPVVVCMISAMCYYPVWWYNLEKGGFFMDDVMIKRNLNVVQPVFDWNQLWRTDYWGLEMFDPKVWTHKSFRPFTVFTFRIDYQTFSFYTTWFHRHNVLLHFVSGTLLYYTSRKLLKFSMMDGLLLAGLFLVHPVHSESICYIVGRADLQCSIFILLSTLAYNRAIGAATSLDQSKKKGAGRAALEAKLFIQWMCWALVALGLVITSGLCKETGFTTFGLFILQEVFALLRGSEIKRVALRASIVLIAGLALCYIRVWYTQGTKIERMDPFSNPISAHGVWYDRFLSYWYVHGAYAKLLIFPLFLNYDYSQDSVPLIFSMKDVRMQLPFAAYLILACSVLHTVRKLQKGAPEAWPLAFGIMSFALAFLPMANLLFPVGTLIAERLLYIPSIGFLICAVCICHKIPLILIGIAWWARCYYRVQDWQNMETITYRDGQTQLRSSRTQFNLGNFHLGRKEYDDALVAYKRAIEVDPEMRDAMPLYHAGQIYIFKGEYEEAEYLLQKAVKGYFSPLTLNEEEVFHDYGLALWHRGKAAEAIYNLQAAILTNQGFTKGYNNVGCAMVLDALSRNDVEGVKQGLGSIEQAIGRSPETALYWRNAAVLLNLIGDPDAARNAWQRYSMMDPGAANQQIPDNCVFEFNFR